MNLTEREDSLLAGLTEYMVVNHAEANLFRPDSTIVEETGCWHAFFDALMNRHTSRGRAFGMRWEMKNELVKPMKGALRFARWLEVNLGNQKLVVALLPHLYTEAGRKPYLDQRFVVAATDNVVLMTGLIFRDYLLGKIDVEDDPPWVNAN